MSYGALTNLMDTLESAVQPDRREKDLETLLYNISKADNSIRSFTITRDTRYLKTYESTINDSHQLLAKLDDQSDQDQLVLAHLDSIEVLLNRKYKTQQRLIELSHQQRNGHIYEDLHKEIEALQARNETIDSIKNVILQAEARLEKQIEEKEREIISQQDSLLTDEPSFFRRLFGTAKKIKSENEKQQKKLQLANRELDTLIAARNSI